MDPLSAIGLAGNIVAFLDFSSKLVSGTYEIYSSNATMTDEHADLAKVIEDVHAVTRRLTYSAGPAVTDDEIALLGLINKCRELSGDLVRSLQRLQAKRPKSKLESFRVAWRAMREKEKFESLEKRIDRYRRQILDRIVIMMSEDTSSIYKLLQQSMKTNEVSALQTRKELQELRETILSVVEKLRLDEIVCQLESENNAEPVRGPRASGASLDEVHTMLSRVSQITATISREDWILNKLSFDQMHDRELSIEDAHTNTFRWLLYDPSDETLDKDAKDEKASRRNQEEEATGLQQGIDRLSKAELSSESRLKDRSDLLESSKAAEAPKDNPNQLRIKKQESEERNKTRLMFLSWLNSGSGVFHISGKLGSGKSTLMKFLSGEARTKQELQKWAGGKRLLFSQFFFWASGSPNQRSLEGLHRGILWETLRECPGLMRDVFPRCWDADFTPVNDRLRDRPFSNSELETAFELLTKSKTVFDNHKICFFIDGLDEFDGDHWKLAHGLKVWSNAGDLKICASSRPYNEFIHTFTDLNKHLRLHELTKQDIQKFVEDEFDHDERSLGVCAQDERYARLIKSLIKKADGVFLWVRLATRELLTGMGNRYSISQLEEELDQLPDDLEALFRKLLTSIRKSDRMRAARAFLIMLSEFEFQGIKTLLVVHAVIDELSDTDTDYDAALLYSGALGPPITRGDLEKMTSTVEGRLNSRCKGLIQISKKSWLKGEKLARLEFIHLSVVRFLAMDEVRAELLQIAGPSFDPAKSMCMAFLRLLKGSYGLAKSDQSAELEEDLSSSDEWHRQVPFGSYFWLLEKLALPILVITRETETEASCPCLRELEVASEIVLKLSTRLPATPAPTAPISLLGCGYQLISIVFLSESNAIDAQERLWLALCALYGARRFVLNRVSQFPDLLCPSARVDLLLLASIGVPLAHSEKISAVRQALVASLLERGVSPNRPLSDSSQYVTMTSSFPRVMKESQTTWTALLHIMTTLLQSSDKMPENVQAEVSWRLIGQYLEYGADPTVVFVGYQIALPEEGGSLDENSEMLVGPTYFDLGQLIEMWDPPNKQALLASWNRKHQALHTLWDMGLHFTRSLWQSNSVAKIPRIKTESLQSSISLVASVVSTNKLPEVDVSGVERWARTTEGRQWLLETKSVYEREIWSVRI